MTSHAIYMYLFSITVSINLSEVPPYYISMSGGNEMGSLGLRQNEPETCDRNSPYARRRVST